MAAKRKKKKKGQATRPEDILAGRATITPLELVRLIHRINPTKKNFNADKSSEQYRLKSHLQSLLIKKYSDSLVVEQPDPEQPQLISIKLKHFSEDACHALLHELEFEARSWVQEQIDTVLVNDAKITGRNPMNGAAGKSAADYLQREVTAPAKGDSNTGSLREERCPEELLNLGHKALEKYDYEKAEKYYSRAFHAAPDNLKIALTLFEFLLDHLAAYEKVLEYSWSLPDRVSKDERIRILRARALARCGKIDEALDCLDRATHPEAGKVYLLAARHFLENGDLKHATRLQNFLKELADADLLLETERLKNDIHQLRIKNLLPLEEKMIDAQRQGEEEKAARLAQKLLTAWPENKIARRIRHDFTKQQKMGEKIRLLERADLARSKGKISREIEILKKVLTVDKDDRLIAQRLTQAEKDAGRKHEEEKINKILNLLKEGREREACTGYPELSHKLRQRLMTETGNRRFHQIERIITEHPTLKPEKMVDAVLVLEQCQELVDHGNDPQRVILKLREHEKVLHSLPEVPGLLQQAEIMAREIKTARAASLLRQAARQLEQKEPRAARQFVDRIKIEDLNNHSREIYQDLISKLKNYEKIHRLSRKYEAEEQAENHLAARDLARQLGVLIPAKDHLWREKAARHNKLLQAEWSLVEVDSKNLPPGYQPAEHNIFKTDYHNCLMPNERDLILVNGFGRWLLVSVFDLDRQAFNKTIVLQTPLEITYPEATLAGQVIWIKGMAPAALALSLEPLEILSWNDFSDLLNDNDIVENILLFPKKQYIWIGISNQKKGGNDLYNIVRVKQHRVERQIKMQSLPVTVNQRGNLQVIFPAYNQTASQPNQIYSVQGRLRGKLASAAGKITNAVTAHPNGNDYLLLSYFDILDDLPLMEEIDHPDFTTENDEKTYDIEDNYQLIMEALPGTEKEPVAVKFPDSHGELVHGIYSLPEKGLVFVHYICHHNHNHRLVTFRFSGNQPVKLYEINAPSKMNLVTNETNQKIIAINYHKNGIQAVALTDTRPEFIIEDTEIFIFGRDLPDTANVMACGEPTGSLKARSLATIMLLREASFIEIATMIEAGKMKADEDPEEIITLIQGLKMTAHFALAIKLETWFKKKNPEHPRNLMERAGEAVRENKWRESVSLLEGISISNLDDGTACHICHLLGLAQFALGQVDDALKTWERGEALEGGGCELASLLAYAEFASMSTGERQNFRADNELFASLDIYERVDACLRERDWLTTITIMENYNITSLNDPQILARLSEAYLHYSVQIGEERWLGKVMVLAIFIDCFKTEITRRCPLLPPYIKTWSDSRMQEVANQAAQWLEQIGTLKN